VVRSVVRACRLPGSSHNSSSLQYPVTVVSYFRHQLYVNPSRYSLDGYSCGLILFPCPFYVHAYCYCFTTNHVGHKIRRPPTSSQIARLSSSRCWTWRSFPLYRRPPTMLCYTVPLSLRKESTLFFSEPASSSVSMLLCEAWQYTSSTQASLYEATLTSSKISEQVRRHATHSFCSWKGSGSGDGVGRVSSDRIG